jgi:hypothetical protein
MNRIFSFALAALLTTVVASPVYAGKDGKGKGKGGGGGGGKVSAPAHYSAPKGGGKGMGGQSYVKAPKYHSEKSFAPKTFTPSMARSKSFDHPKYKSPSVAFGGQVIDKNYKKNKDFVVKEKNGGNLGKNGGNFGKNPPRQFSRGGYVAAYQPPIQVCRDWDHRRIHEWNHCRYRWDDNADTWVSIDFGYPGYPYDSGYGYGYYDYGRPLMYSSGYSSGSLAASVQDRLARRGYDPGPIDGVVGGQTRDAIAEFQNDHGLPVTGDIDRPLLRALGL